MNTEERLTIGAVEEEIEKQKAIIKWVSIHVSRTNSARTDSAPHELEQLLETKKSKAWDRQQELENALEHARKTVPCVSVSTYKGAGE